MPHYKNLRRLLSILLLLILLFNFYGYRLMIDCMQQREQALLSARLDKEQYNEDELISIKTSLNLPYYSSSPEFERAYGSVRVNGVDYQYVKRRVFNDTLELLCLPDRAKTKLQLAKNDWFRLSLEGQTTDKKAPGLIKIYLPDYFQEQEHTSFALQLLQDREYFSQPGLFSPQDYSSRQERPPRSMQFSV